jgi:phosphomannomutase/phosphoglucomutase
VEILAHSQHSLSELLSDLPKTYSTPEIRLDCPDAVKFKVVDSLKAKFQDSSSIRSPFPIQEVNTVDGMRITFSNGWGLVRASNTQPALVLRYEADSQDDLSKIKDFIESLTYQTIQLAGHS